MSARYLGMRQGDLDGKAYARFWRPAMALLSEEAREALARGPIAEPLLPPIDRAASLLDAGDHAIESGFTLADDGSLRVAIRTAMPGVSAAMIDWWFGWHSDEPQRYKLWHPRAHVHAAWRAGGERAGRGRERYVGRTSLVDEYVGSALGRYAIRFVLPRQVGLDEARLDAGGATAVCARVGFAAAPIDFGWLVHHVRPVAGGAEMRSRFWIGGPHAGARGAWPIGALAVQIAKRAKRPRADDARALLVHCADEMAHLASFLPRLHAELGDE